ncbi:hypothetical protein [Streptomyces sp. NPDC002994]|uniref:hypothetical protein n=1 Tax=Streptomyces sp. NPDC002994 TaxID=3154441 RepID=UPI0033AFC521
MIGQLLGQVLAQPLHDYREVVLTASRMFGRWQADPSGVVRDIVLGTGADRAA